MSTLIWIIIAVVVVLVLAALIATLGNRKRKDRNRQRAEEIRGGASGHVATVQDTRLQAEQAEAQAQRDRAAAEQAEARAAEARQAAQVEQARHEDQVREADRIDPDVDHKAADYRPAAAGAPGHEGQAPVGETPDDHDAGSGAHRGPVD